MYILQVKNFEDTKTLYFRAKTFHEFLSILPQVQIDKGRIDDNFDVIL